MNKNKRIILLIVFSLFIVTLFYINSKNDNRVLEEMKVDAKFISAILDDNNISNQVISSNKLEINFTSNELSKLGDISTLKYSIKNNSKEYGVNVLVNCELPENDTYTISNILDNKNVKIKEELSGTLEIKATENIKSPLKLNCTLVLKADKLN